jgi:hypothetical protein
LLDRSLARGIGPIIREHQPGNCARHANHPPAVCQPRCRLSQHIENTFAVNAHYSIELVVSDIRNIARKKHRRIINKDIHAVETFYGGVK